MKIELLNMCMVFDGDKVLALDKVGSWRGVTFPGGHVEKKESLVESTIREIKEETGLDVKNLKLCGVVHYCDKITSDRFMVFLYKTDHFSGELIEDMREGHVFWTTIDEMKKMVLAPNMATYLEIFTQEEYSEAFSEFNENSKEELRLI